MCKRIDADLKNFQLSGESNLLVSVESCQNQCALGKMLLDYESIRNVSYALGPHGTHGLLDC